MSITLLDGPIGTVLIERGHPAPAPAWSADCLIRSPESVASLHREYVAAGATHHTANTFRTRLESVGNEWKELAEKAINITRSATPEHHKVLASIAPIQDCYRPDLSPKNPVKSHKRLAEVLAHAGADILLCETFPHIDEGLSAAEAALSTGIETWLSFTAGPKNNLLRPKDIQLGAAKAAKMGVSAVLVNCIPAAVAHHYIESIAEHGIPCGIYANAGDPNEGIGWGSGTDGPKIYADYAARWVESGVQIIGSCCGTGPSHIRELASRFTKP